METGLPALVGLIGGASIASGLRLYATVAVLGLLGRYEVIRLPAGLAVLTHTWVIGIATGLYVIEFVADKVPVVDSAWDAVHTFIRIPAAAALAWAAFGELPEPWRAGAALLAGSVALGSHGLKSGARLAINTSPEPFTNWGASVAEEIIVAGVLWIAVAHPWIAGIAALLVVILAVALASWIFKAMRRIFRSLFSDPDVPAPA